MLDYPRLRGVRGSQSGPWPIGRVPEYVIREIGKQIVLRLAIGRKDISGNDFSEIFATAVNGVDYASPLGLADVALQTTAWSVKTIQSSNPFGQQRVRLISGRNSPDYSFGISDPHADLQKTGDAVLSIWNARLNTARNEHNDLRIVVLIRNVETKQFVIFEDELRQYAAGNYKWGLNPRGNLNGCERNGGRHVFTWQFHGGQFTVLRNIPASARRFAINRDVPLVEPSRIERLIEYSDDWIDLR
ncbi:MAG: hypothetical protein OXI60_08995 [Acidiferrobacterales bacterium]|nr:hypothetical protein [Acidiferrobacterales bacterium]